MILNLCFGVHTGSLFLCNITSPEKSPLDIYFLMTACFNNAIQLGQYNTLRSNAEYTIMPERLKETQSLCKQTKVLS